MYKSLISIVSAGACLLALGCGGDQQPNDAVSSDTRSEAPASEYLVTTEPADFVPVGQAMESTEDGQQIAMVGVVGGSSKPFVDGIAAFTIVDPKVPYCAADEGCPTPWDYCCTMDQVKGNIATIKVVDEAGDAVATDARQLLGIEELSEVVVVGTVQRDQQGNLSLAARKVFKRS
jgi:hypothetical protein